MQNQCPADLVRSMESDPLGYDLALWSQMADFGWMGLPFSKQYGGMDGTFVDLVVLVEPTME